MKSIQAAYENLPFKSKRHSTFFYSIAFTAFSAGIIISSCTRQDSRNQILGAWIDSSDIANATHIITFDEKNYTMAPALSLKYEISKDTLKWYRGFAIFHIKDNDVLSWKSFLFLSPSSDTTKVYTLPHQNLLYYRYTPQPISNYKPPFTIILNCGTGGIKNAAIFHLMLKGDSVFFSGKKMPELQGDFCGAVDSCYLRIISDAINSTSFPSDSILDISTDEAIDNSHYYVSIAMNNSTKKLYMNRSPIRFYYLLNVLFNIPNHMTTNYWKSNFNLNEFYRKEFTRFNYYPNHLAPNSTLNISSKFDKRK